MKKISQKILLAKMLNIGRCVLEPKSGSKCATRNCYQNMVSKDHIAEYGRHVIYHLMQVFPLIASSFISQYDKDYKEAGSSVITENIRNSKNP